MKFLNNFYSSINNKMKEVMNLSEYMPDTARAERAVTRAARALILAKTGDPNNPATEKAVGRADAILTNAMNAADAIAIMEIEKMRTSRKRNWNNWIEHDSRAINRVVPKA